MRPAGTEGRGGSSIYRDDAIREVHVELTTRCNVSCPQCPRNIAGGEVNPGLPLTEPLLADVQRIFPSELLGRLRVTEARVTAARKTLAVIFRRAENR